MNAEEIYTFLSRYRLRLLYVIAVVALVGASLAVYYSSAANQPVTPPVQVPTTSSSTSSSGQVDVSDQLSSLKVSNTLISYERALSNLYLVTYDYEITNEQQEPVRIESAVSYFLQQNQIVDIKGITKFTASNKAFRKSSDFNGLTNSRLSNESFTLGAGQSLQIEIVAQIFTLDNTPPVRNVVEFSGTGTTTTKLHSGSGVAIFYPGIVIGQ